MTNCAVFQSLLSAKG